MAMPMERKERKERNLKNQSNETAAKEERTRDCYRSREKAQIHCLPTSWLVECFAAWVVCATTSLPALAQLDSKHVLLPRGGNKMRYNGIHHADCRENGPRREECLEW
eukprot:scaffold9985_cov70-Skeletonema_dohrnii-CCMP3373.AAC.1